jgi:hypothetical protein
LEYAYIDVRDEYRDGKLFESRKSCEILDSHCGVADVLSILGCDAVSLGE